MVCHHLCTVNALLTAEKMEIMKFVVGHHFKNKTPGIQQTYWEKDSFQVKKKKEQSQF